jgi:putative membrane protein
MKRIRSVAIICAAMFVLGCDVNDRRERDSTAAVGTAGNEDKAFVEHMLTAGMAEVELGTLAKSKAVNPEVKEFAEMMVRDHSKAGAELKQIATGGAIDFPAQLDERHRDLVQKMSDASGADFDRQYMDVMVDSHEDVIDRLQTRASEDRFGDDKGTVRPEGSDNRVEADINQWAANTLVTARHHLEEAKRIDASLGNRMTRK